MNTDELRAVAVAQLVYEAQARRDPIAFYKPNPPQDIFHRSASKERWFVGGNRAGKTYANAAEGIMLALGIHPHHQITVPNDGWFVSLDNKQGLEAIVRCVRTLLPKNQIKDDRVADQMIVLKNGSTLGFKSCDSGWEKFQGASKDWIGFDEEPPQIIWRECRMRTIDRRGMYWVTMTPVKGITWAHEYLKGAIAAGYADQVTASIYDNIWIDAKEVERVIKGQGFSDTELRARLKGEWVTMAGASVFDEVAINRQQKHIRTPRIQGELEYRQFTENAPAPLVEVDPILGAGVGVEAKVLQQALAEKGYEERAQLWQSYTIQNHPQNRLRIWRRPEPRHYYSIGADPSGGYAPPENMWDASGERRRASDPAAALILDTVTGEFVAEWLGVIPPELFAEKLYDLAGYYNGALLVIENNTFGQAVIKRVVDLGYANIWRSVAHNDLEMRMPARLGFTTGKNTRRVLIGAMAQALLEDEVVIPNQLLLDELRTFIVNDKGKEEAAYGCHDDRVIAGALALIGRGQSGRELAPDRQPEAVQHDEMMQESVTGWS